MGAANGGRSCFGQPEVPDLAGADELLHGARDILDGHLRVDAVLVEQVDDVGAQTPQGAVDRGTYVLGPATDPALMSALVEREAELRRDDDLVADRLQGLTNDLLVRERPVHLGRVEERDAVVDGLAQERDHVRAFGGRAETLADPHAAQPDRPDREGVSERTSGHSSVSFRSGSRHFMTAAAREAWPAARRQRRRGSAGRGGAGAPGEDMEDGPPGYRLSAGQR